MNEFEQVIINLIKNSKDAFEKDKTIKDKIIKISAKQEQNFITIDIEDNAGGIKNEILDKIFEPYFTTKKGGTGIGLYISKMLIDEMKGSIEVSTNGGKTKFTIKLLKG